MSQAVLEEPAHWPTLQTILMVEETLQKADESALSIAELKRQLPRKVNHNSLMAILRYLEDSNKIAVSLRGLTWIHNPNPFLRQAIARGRPL